MTGGGLRLEGVSAGYRTSMLRHKAAVIVSEATAVAHPGRVTVLLGANGSGKSTLLRTIIGLQPALSGRISLDGLPLPELKPARRAQLIAAVLTDRFDPGLLTGRDIVTLGRHPHLGVGGRLTGDDLAAIGQALHAVRAAGFAAAPLARMSDGQRQRIMIARALAQQTAALILDEPTAFLDGPARVELFATIGDIARRRRIVVVVSTHDVASAISADADGWLLSRGRLADIGRLDTAAAAKAIGAAFDTDTVRFDRSLSAFTLRNRQQQTGTS